MSAAQVLFDVNNSMREFDFAVLRRQHGHHPPPPPPLPPQPTQVSSDASVQSAAGSEDRRRGIADSLRHLRNRIHELSEDHTRSQSAAANAQREAQAAREAWLRSQKLAEEQVDYQFHVNHCENLKRKEQELALLREMERVEATYANCATRVAAEANSSRCVGEAALREARCKVGEIEHQLLLTESKALEQEQSRLLAEARIDELKRLLSTQLALIKSLQRANVSAQFTVGSSDSHAAGNETNNNYDYSYEPREQCGNNYNCTQKINGSAQHHYQNQRHQQEEDEEEEVEECSACSPSRKRSSRTAASSSSSFASPSSRRRGPHSREKAWNPEVASVRDLIASAEAEFHDLQKEYRILREAQLAGSTISSHINMDEWLDRLALRLEQKAVQLRLLRNC
eukprot:gnl/Spiro4/13605_TR7250_c0_g1_i1.p1 gnl/Spiro4/13605_TR7250_c0_g1~~gnl/Spiro4/13605_TR7250_c0_g1_i1.p1  ORF type:complete len:417 (+),score=58.66 gnl/Spiro4/13605_TR7250_c0_g1_i1:58-1251(+)